MILDIINSGSNGNCYILHNNTEALVLEAGVPLKKITDILGGVSCIRACLITHEHSDHAGYIEQYMARGVECYCTKGTASNLKYKWKWQPNEVNIGKIYHFGGFSVFPIKTIHDYPTCRAIEPCGYLISHEETGTVLFATDTQYLENKFEKLSNVLIEANYDEKLLNDNVVNGFVDKARAERTKKTHMSLNTCIDTLKANDLSNVNNIVLIHLSRENAEPEFFQSKVGMITGKKVYSAIKGLRLTDFNKIKQ